MKRRHSPEHISGDLKCWKLEIRELGRRHGLIAWWFPDTISRLRGRKKEMADLKVQCSNYSGYFLLIDNREGLMSYEQVA